MELIEIAGRTADLSNDYCPITVEPSDAGFIKVEEFLNGDFDRLATGFAQTMVRDEIFRDLIKAACQKYALLST